MKDLVIIGAGGFGREMCAHIRLISEKSGKSEWNLLGLIDENPSLKETVEGYKVLGNLDYYLNMENKPYFFIAIANSYARERIATRCKAAGCKAATIMYPNVDLGDNVEIGEGCFISKDAMLRNEVKIGPFCIVQSQALFGHDTTVGAYTSFMANAIVGGETHIGSHCYFGLRTTVINRINITDECTVGACACVVKDAEVPGTYVGVPAKLIKPLQK